MAQLGLCQGVRIGTIKTVFLTHLHGDHCFGVFGLLRGLNLAQNTSEIHIIGPTGVQELVTTVMRLSDTQLRFALRFTELDPQKHSLGEIQGLSVEAYPLEHRVSAFGYRFQERGGNRRSVAILQDTCDSSSAVNGCQGCDLLIHEATYDHTLHHKAMEYKHSTARMAGAFARQVGAKVLLLTHFSARYNDRVRRKALCSDLYSDRIPGTNAEPQHKHGKTLQHLVREAAEECWPQTRVHAARDFICYHFDKDRIVLSDVLKKNKMLKYD